MQRRTLMGTALALTLLPLPSFAADYVDYEPGVIEAALADGKTVFVDYAATWCSTCARQERILADLRGKNPAYDEAMTFIKVDWDAYGDHEVTTSRDIPRRSTLLVLRGEEELGRIVAGTSESDIKALLDIGLSANGA